MRVVTTMRFPEIARAVCILHLCAATAGATVAADGGTIPSDVSTGDAPIAARPAGTAASGSSPQSGSRAQAPGEVRNSGASGQSTRSPFDDDGLVLGAISGFGTVAGWLGAFVGHELGFGPLRALNPFAAVAIGATPYTGTQYGGLLRMRPFRVAAADTWLFVELGYSQGDHDVRFSRHFHFEGGGGNRNTTELSDGPSRRSGLRCGAPVGLAWQRHWVRPSLCSIPAAQR